MSAWLEIIGWFLIVVVGGWMIFSTTRSLRRLMDRTKDEPALRFRLWRKVWLAPYSVVWGVFCVSYGWWHGSLLWLPIAYLAVVVICDLVGRSRLRRKTGPPGHAAGWSP